MKISIFKSFLFILTISITSLFSQNNDDSLVAHYKLSEEYFDNQVEDKFYDLSGNGNHANPVGKVKFTSDQYGENDAAMIFDTVGVDNYLNCGSSENFKLIGDRTIMIWLNQKVVDKRHNENIFSKGKKYSQYNFTFNRPKGLFAIQSRNSRKDFKIFQSDYNIKLFREKYHLFSFILNNSKDSVNIYRNCIFQYKMDISEFDFDKPGDFLIGHGPYAYNSGHPNNTFQGKISEFMFYKRKLKISEMEEIYNNCKPHYVDWNFEANLKGDYSDLKLEEAFSSYGNNKVVSEIEAYSGEFCLKHTCSPNNNRSEIWLEERYEGYKEYSDGDPNTSPDPMVKSNHTNGETRWYKWYFLLPEKFTFGELNSIIIMQMFERAQNVGISPTYHISIHKKNRSPFFRFYSVLWEEDSDGNIAQQAYCYDPNQDIPVVKGEWNEIVLHVKMSTSDDGFLEGWINGKPILKQKAEYTYRKRKQRNRDNRSIRYDGNEKYTYTISNYKIYGRNLALDDWNGSQFRVGQYRGEDATTNSVFTDVIQIGKTAKSVNFNPINPEDIKPQIKITNNPIDIGKTKINTNKKYNFSIANVGQEDLIIHSGELLNNDVFNIDSIPNRVAGETAKNINIEFEPLELETYSDTLMIISNNVISDTTIIGLKGRGAKKPKLEIQVP